MVAWRARWGGTARTWGPPPSKRAAPGMGRPAWERALRKPRFTAEQILGVRRQAELARHTRYPAGLLVSGR